ncbi:MAG: DedA family protein [Nanoarchaeota archaeon]
MIEFLFNFIDFFLHLDKSLGGIIQQYGTATYIILFLIILSETGLVIAPLLPGDSLLFAAGTFAAIGSLNISLLFVLLVIAAIIGDSINYSVGNFVGSKVFSKKSRFFRKEYLDKTKAFYDKYGGKTIIIARFMPIIRTFAPFVAGIGKMKYGKFIFYNVVGGIMWVTLFTFGGYYFGNMPAVKENFSLVILAIVALSILPAVIEYIRNRK